VKNFAKFNFLGSKQGLKMNERREERKEKKIVSLTLAYTQKPRNLVRRTCGHVLIRKN
jgi:hypothetical protein